MAAETLYAVSGGTGVTTPANAYGAPNGVFTTDAGGVSWTAAFDMGDPSGPVAAGSTQTVTITVRKNSSLGNNPTVTNIEVGDGTTWTPVSGVTFPVAVSNATLGQTIVGTVPAAAIPANAALTQIRVTTVASGGQTSSRRAVQLDAVRWDTTTSEAPATITGSGAVTAPAATATGAGGVVLTGAAAASGPAASADGAGSLSLAGSGAGAAPVATADGEGGLAVSGAGAAAAPAPAAAGTGSIGNPAITGSGSPAAPAAEADGSGSVVLTGSGNEAAPLAEADGAGTLTTAGSGSPHAPAATAGGQGTTDDPNPAGGAQAMAKWLFNRTGTHDYPTLGFTATNGDILDAVAAPDAYWSLNGDQGAAETVDRYGTGSYPAPDGNEPDVGAVLVWDGTAYVPESTTLPTWIQDAIDAQLDAQPGAELGYAELEADFTTTNTSNLNVTDGPGAGGVIPGFSVTVVGTGRAVSIHFHAPQVRHTTASAFVNAYLVINGVANGGDGQNSLGDSPATNIGRELTMIRRLVLTNGVSYTFKIGIQGGIAGTATIDGADGTAISLQVVGH